MRATAACIHGCGKKRKRKLEEDDSSNEFNLSNQSECNKENIWHIGIKDSCNASSPKMQQKQEEKKVVRLTQEIIRRIYDSVKKSTSRIMSSKIFRFSATSEKEREADFRENKAASSVIHSLSVQHNSRLSRPLVETNSSLHRVGCKANVLALPLTDNFCIKGEFDREKELWLTSCRMNLRYLSSYLKHKRSILRRSKTSLLPSHIVCSSTDINEYLRLIEEDPMISLFLRRDVCRRYADKFLLSMVLVYFARARLTPNEFSRESFFAALYLAHDMEEDIEETKFEVFPYCLGTRWKKLYPYLLSVRDDLFWSLDCRAVVSRKCCEQVMSLIPEHWMWRRERPEYHADVFSQKLMEETFDHPKGPFKTPLWCRACLEKECGDSDNSYIVYTSLSDTSSHTSQDSWGTPDTSKILKKDSGFESLLRPNEEDDDGTNVHDSGDTKDEID